MIRKRSLAGRNDTGRIVIWTKSSLKIRCRNVKINYNLNFRKLGFVAGFKFLSFKSKLLSLIFFSNGSVSYYLSTEFHKLMMFLHSKKYKNIRNIKFPALASRFFQIKKLSYVSCLEILPGKGAQYSRSAGTKSRLFKFEKSNHTVLIELPSGLKKAFSYYSFALLGQLTMPLHYKRINGKAGFWRNFGAKPIVRGVAMNPVDHPHGGRTKAIQHQRTPWGHTTKYK